MGRRRLFFPLFFVAAFFGLSFLVQTLWNHILVDVTTVKTLTYPQAMGILVLSKILFGGFGPRPQRTPFGGHQRWREKWKNMDEDERTRFRSEWKRRFGRDE
ncbi:hypothetical protein [Siphonobacter sp. SORGH_AS_1065]|uniref:hypothetical protein n=1 Tax=Siphonobacter sp. SORGH_AS_1065 TaxID=3041795 RepID=UPI00278641BC|nr:hypothetical protein [Siphonobacter sp. SORGH_AS_1065]MDQ1087248.1 hypothetical protein [Siphonobacter sp. SORGH_AS_1065]